MVGGIPQAWLVKVALRERIEEFVDGLLEGKSDSSGSRIARETSEPPLGRTYLVEPGRLLAGYNPGSEKVERAKEKLSALQDAGVRCLVNPVEEVEGNWSGQGLRPYEEVLRHLAEDAVWR